MSLHDNMHSRQSWLRRCTQFSLRSLLLVMTASAIGCWWWLRPGTREEALANGQLKLQRQVLFDREAKPVTPEPPINVGAWRLYGRRGELLVDGNYRRGVPQGTWTLYYTSGQKAAQGLLVRGQRTGVWRTWNERGRLVSEVTYRPATAEPAANLYDNYRLPDPPAGFCGSVIGAKWGTRERRHFCAPPLPAVRHGKACLFSESGEVQSSVTYIDDRRMDRTN